MPWENVNGIMTWANWSTTYLTNATTSNDPIGTMVNSTAKAVPWLWPFFSWILYLFLLFTFRESNSRWKWPGITLIAAVISLIMAWSDYIGNAILNVIFFGISILISTMFKT